MENSKKSMEIRHDSLEKVPRMTDISGDSFFLYKLPLKKEKSQHTVHTLSTPCSHAVHSVHSELWTDSYCP